MNRRKFIRSSAHIAGLGISLPFIPKTLWSSLLETKSSISTITSDNPKVSIPRLIESLGGIEKFVKPGNSVGFLVNSPWVHKGYYTHPDIPLMLMQMCKEAGAERIICYKPVRNHYWEESSFYEDMKPLIHDIIYGEERVDVAIKGGKEMTSASVYKVFMETDVFINVPVAKHHNGTIYSGVLKNLMGVSSRETNRHMHSPEGEYTYGKTEYLSNCIADLNLIRTPDLSVIDATVCALNNGPRGPGDTISPGLIIAGTDPLAMDVYASGLLGMDPNDILTFNAASKLGLGINDTKTIKVREL